MRPVCGRIWLPCLRNRIGDVKETNGSNHYKTDIGGNKKMSENKEKKEVHINTRRVEDGDSAC